MAWYDTPLDIASVAFPAVGASVQAGKAIGNFVQGKPTSFFGADSRYTPPPPPGAATQTTRLSREQQTAFNPFADPRYRDQYNQAGSYAEDGRSNQSNADRQLMQGYSAPTYSGPQSYTPQSVRATAPNANTSAGGAGLDRAVDYLGNTNSSRAAQEGVYNTAVNWANGNMPSVGQNIANEAGAIAGEQFQRAGSEANQAYGGAQNTAGLAYSDAAAQQAEATRRAGVDASRQVRDAAGQAVLQQSALTSAARGGNIGMALRAGLQGAAMQSADAGRQGARLMNDANQAAAYNAAAAQRQASANQANANLATQGTQERAGFAAASAEEQARFRAAQIGSQEQQNALGLAAGVSGDLRSGDVSAANAATGLANTGLGIDQMVNAANQANADRAFQADTFNANLGMNAADMNNRYGLAYDELNSGNQLAYDQLNSGNLNQVANRGAQATQFGMGAQQQGALQGIMSNQQLATMFMQLDEASKQRMLDAYVAQQGQATQRRGQNIGLFGGAASALGGMGAAAITSDRRAKKNIRKETAPDFTKAGTYSYEYKDPEAPGSRKGRQTGPMAQELPDDVVTRGDDGVIRVDIAKLALSLTSAVGDLQRKVA